MLRNDFSLRVLSRSKGTAISTEVARKAAGRLHWPTRIRFGLTLSDALSDALAIAVALITTIYIRWPSPDSQTIAGTRHITYSALAVVFGLVWLLILSTNDSHRIRLLSSGLQEYQLVARGTLWAFGSLAIFSYLFKLSVSRSLFLVQCPGRVVLSFCGGGVVRV
ncbi:UDP-phosphate galactose phosphotransferase [Cutibacterium avidum]|uniref:UDP-phosphate galactose phosphotransferase n=1 Tax=Cutibacterium avidum TaxID=33010 RepID=UPI0008F58F5B|nr:UDP-phosphate galactose phosphotransferase [Cutibacterium avidum]MDK7699662.1 UDP-phosphate galactose phosphotransferase [Cutibacterium avidum]OIJ78436.1 UDP-phosphate galactose phosphotransferase [Cutibacterium avidum]